MDAHWSVQRDTLFSCINSPPLRLLVHCVAASNSMPLQVSLEQHRVL